MAVIQTCSTNLLEASTVSLTTGAAATGYPLYRLYDRDIGRVFAGSAATTTVIRVDQGAGGAQAVDRLLIPSGHNLAGVTCELAHSPDAASWTDALGGTFVAAAGGINKAWTSVVKRYWRLTMTSPAAAPQIAEMFLSPSAAWARNPDHPGGAEEDLHNVTVALTAAGRPRFEINGVSLRQRNYTLTGITDTQRTQLLALWGDFAGSKPFWFCDPDDVWIYGRMTSGLGMREQGVDPAGVAHHAASFTFLEVPA